MAASQTPVATEADSVASGLLIYDGDCGICTKLANWFDRRSRCGISIAPSHSLDLESLDLTIDQALESVWWRHNGTNLGGADAVGAALGSLGHPWRLASRVLARPGVIHLARRIYPVIGRHRHRLPGSTDACKL